MYTQEEAVEKFMQNLPWGLKDLYQQDKLRNLHPFYCSHCGWYYPHDNWETNKCPLCGQDIIQADNSEPTFGLFAM